MKNIFFTGALFAALSFTGIAQEEKSNTIDSQFTDLIENSNTYQSYKVIKIPELLKVQKNVEDSIIELKANIFGSETIILEQKSKIDSVIVENESLRVKLEETQKEVDTISFLGIPTQKATYSFIMWGIIIGLFLVSTILFLIFKKGNSKTKEAQGKLASTELELDTLRKRSLEREQKVRRELQDEINKNRLRKE